MPSYYPPATSAGGGGTPDDNSVTSAKIVDGAIVNADINAAAAIAYSKLALTGAIVTGDITDGTILGGDLSSTIAIPSAATATTQTAADGTTKLATTAYVDTADALKANLASPTFTGHPVGVTESAATNSTRLATTAYVDGTYGNSVVSGLPKLVRRTSDATAVNSGNSGTVLTSDSQLLWAIGASEVWYFQAYLLVNAANASMDSKFGLSVPASATATWAALATANPATANEGGYTAAGTAASPVSMQSESGFILHGTAAVTSGLSLAGVVVNSTNAGNVTLQWAQNTADAGNLLLKTNSLIIAWRLA